MEQIKNITVYNDDIIHIQVECSKCRNINVHDITKSSCKNNDGHIIINFSNLGERSCDGISNFKDPIKSKCTNRYKIYQ